MTIVKMGEGDTGPDLDVFLEDGIGTRPDLTGATVTFRMTRRGAAEPTVDATATAAADQTTDLGRVVYGWAEGDTDEVGTYLAEWHVTFSDGEVITYPNGEKKLTVVVAARV